MANGFCPSLLRHINDVANDNAPGRKLHVAGFTAMALCCQNSTVSVLNDRVSNGQNRPLTVKYTQRPLISAVQTDAGCDNDLTPGYSETTLPGWTHRQLSFHIPDDTMRQYCIDAVAMRSIGGATNVMQEVYERILETANALLGSMNRALVASMSTEFGTNVTTGSYGGSLININEDGSKYILDNGVVQMLTDLEVNQICGEVCAVGSGIYHNYMVARSMTGLNAGGMNQAGGPVPAWNYDKDTASLWGPNSIGVFAKGSLALLTYDQYVGPYSGQRGQSYFTNFTLPTNEFACAPDCLDRLSFDLQLRYNDCAENGLQPGWQAIVSKKFALWVQPDTLYQTGDPLAGSNGTLKYWFDNSTYTGASYARY